jgi:hypothetical protein
MTRALQNHGRPGCLLMLAAMFVVAGLATVLLSAPPADASLPRVRRGCSTNSAPRREAGTGSINFSHVFGGQAVGLTICPCHQPIARKMAGVFELRTDLRQGRK